MGSPHVTGCDEGYLFFSSAEASRTRPIRLLRPGVCRGCNLVPDSDLSWIALTVFLRGCQGMRPWWSRFSRTCQPVSNLRYACRAGISCCQQLVGWVRKSSRHLNEQMLPQLCLPFGLDGWPERCQASHIQVNMANENFPTAPHTPRPPFPKRLSSMKHLSPRRHLNPHNKP